MTHEPSNGARSGERYRESPDPLIEEIRAIREQIWERDGRDMRRHAEEIRRLEAQWRVDGRFCNQATNPPHPPRGNKP